MGSVAVPGDMERTGDPSEFGPGGKPREKEEGEASESWEEDKREVVDPGVIGLQVC